MSYGHIFSGQGSQYVGMMLDLYEEYPDAKDLIEQANDILEYNLSEIAFDGPIDKLKETRFTQPAIFLHSAVLINLIGENIKKTAVAGHSVGEYAALYSAQVLSFEDALRIVSKRGELMFLAGETEPGTMFAIIGMDDDKVEEVCNKLNKESKSGIVVPANYNSPGQVVVSGSRDYLREIAPEFKKNGAKLAKELVVSGAFHSPLMQPAKEELAKLINSIKFKNAKVPVYSNVYAKAIKNASDIKEALISQLTSPVRWSQTLFNMQNDGIDTFIEIGPGNVLQGLVKRTLKNIEFFGIDRVEDIKKYL